MRTGNRLLPGLAVVAALVLAAVAIAEDESKKVPILQKWSGKIKDERLQKESPNTGYINNATSFAKLWKAWRPDDKVPEINFKEEIVVVATAAGPNDVTVIPQLNEKGNLAILARGTLVEGPGFAYQIAVIKRAGIKTIKGKEIVND
jgi:hypothetical protein